MSHLMTPVTFQDSFGNYLRGITHVSADNYVKSLGIILINSGVKDRVGPHRLYYKIANYLLKLKSDYMNNTESRDKMLLERKK